MLKPGAALIRQGEAKEVGELLAKFPFLTSDPTGKEPVLHRAIRAGDEGMVLLYYPMGQSQTPGTTRETHPYIWPVPEVRYSAHIY